MNAALRRTRPTTDKTTWCLWWRAHPYWRSFGGSLEANARDRTRSGAPSRDEAARPNATDTRYGHPATGARTTHSRSRKMHRRRAPRRECCVLFSTASQRRTRHRAHIERKRRAEYGVDSQTSPRRLRTTRRPDDWLFGRCASHREACDRQRLCRARHMPGADSPRCVWRLLSGEKANTHRSGLVVVNPRGAGHITSQEHVFRLDAEQMDYFN